MLINIIPQNVMTLLRRLFACLAIGLAAASHASPIAGQYIVVFKENVGNPHAQAGLLTAVHGGRLIHSYGAAIKGFSATLSQAAVAALQQNPDVAFIEQDQTVQASTVQARPTWGLDRIDQRSLPLDAVYDYTATGSGVTAFIVDTGIYAAHTDFGGRVLASAGFTGFTDTVGTGDCNGHGTHVADIVGGTTYGVAKQVSLIPVRVLDCNGSGATSTVIAGVDWVAKSTRHPAVVNMSLGGGKSTALNAAVAAVVSRGMTVVVAAGNENQNACNVSPASEPTAITVGATAVVEVAGIEEDRRESYSNWGPCLDIFAPGSSITAAWIGGPTAVRTLSGTSMAAPFVTGVAALAAQHNAGASPARIAELILGSATANQITYAGTGSPNLLVYSNVGVLASSITIAVASLSSATSSTLEHWQAIVTIGIRDVVTNTPAANVTVDAMFTPGGAVSCVTGSTGTCTVTSPTLSHGTAATVLAVSQATGTHILFDSSQNSASQITVYKP